MGPKTSTTISSLEPTSNQNRLPRIGGGLTEVVIDGGVGGIVSEGGTSGGVCSGGWRASDGSGGGVDSGNGCFKCGENDHVARVCPTEGGGGRYSGGGVGSIGSEGGTFGGGGEEVGDQHTSGAVAGGNLLVAGKFASKEDCRL
ncbi:cold shock protein 2-like [Salvia miltiorrhiza]|uniref:cold shock protein 2-like n=1 Tax=Salvia miltiorrhiza TaxID=226208 RepID=UPI0025AD483C|nr:cold shock protein 2-like [Salvia miltiorrhiza]